MERFVRWCLDSPEQARRQGERARTLVLQNQGAASRTAEYLLGLLDHTAQAPDCDDFTGRVGSFRKAI
jgi:hypothetical protein